MSHADDERGPDSVVGAHLSETPVITSHRNQGVRDPRDEKADTKETNPKDDIGVTKLPMHLVPGSAKAYMTMAFLEGALKYGKYNWRPSGVRCSIYLDALERHLEKFKNGEWNDKKTKVPHLASIMACCAIILDSDLMGNLNDDRPPAGPVAELIDSLADHVAHLQELFRDETPHQCVITDEPKRKLTMGPFGEYYDD